MMDTASLPLVEPTGAQRIPEGVVCPCERHGRLSATPDGAVCEACGRRFHCASEVWDLLIGERFDDEACECMWCNEEDTGRHLVTNYLAPELRRRFPDRDPASLRVLSIGCGVGSDVEALNELGFAARGIDAGNRSAYWARRKRPDTYFLANAKHLPFADGYFDVVLMGCVLPHIGVGDDTYVTQPGAAAERQQAADEMLRVTASGGALVLSSPNRHCPIDFFHRPDRHSHRPRLHSPAEDFLLSVDDYAHLLHLGRATTSVEVLPLRGYWGFYSSSRYLLGRILQIPVRWYFNEFMSWQWTKPLRATALNPWLILYFRKQG
jgi:SAM-dependent methyltransferase